jgi:hypothetical protein
MRVLTALQLVVYMYIHHYVQLFFLSHSGIHNTCSDASWSGYTKRHIRIVLIHECAHVAHRPLVPGVLHTQELEVPERLRTLARFLPMTTLGQGAVSQHPWRTDGNLRPD